MMSKTSKYVKEEVERKIKYFELGSVSNIDMQNISEKLGFTKQWLNYRKKI